MRELADHEKVALIGYPGDGDYIAAVDGKNGEGWILGGELWELYGTSLTEQAAVLHKYYPRDSRLVVATIRGSRLVELRKYCLSHARRPA